MSTPKGIDYFNRRHWLTRWQVRYSLRMRRQMLEKMPLRESRRILEVGATPDMALADSNFFARAAKERGCDVWITSPEDCTAVAQRYGLNWIPFSEILSSNAWDRHFDLVISSAVIEHVGGQFSHKVDHIALLRRLSSRYIAATTPNRRHWFEIHTKLPLIHWLPKPLHRRLLGTLGLKPWNEGSHLDLLTLNDLRRVCEQVYQPSNIRYETFRLFGAVSNLLAVCEAS